MSIPILSNDNERYYKIKFIILIYNLSELKKFSTHQQANLPRP